METPCLVCWLEQSPDSVFSRVALEHVLFPPRAVVCDVGHHVDWDTDLGPPIDEIPEGSHELCCWAVSFHVEHLVSDSWLRGG